MPDTSAPLILQRDGAIAHLKLNRAQQGNAIDLPLARAFRDACSAISTDPGVRVVILAAEGKNFGVGGDLAALRSGGVAAANEIIGPMHDALRMLAEMDAPVVARLQGNVAGGSMSLALACDLAIAAEDTRFNLAYVRIGASCDLSASWSLPRLVGLRNAMAIALLGDSIDAAEALRLGLVNKVVPADKLDETVSQVAQRLAAGPTRAIGRLKHLMRDSLQRTLDAQLDAERDAFVASAGTADFAEGIDAFFAKRPASFSGA